MYAAVGVVVFIVGAAGSFFVASSLNADDSLQSVATASETRTAKSIVDYITQSQPPSLAALTVQDGAGVSPLITGFLPDVSFAVGATATASLSLVATDASVTINEEKVLAETNEIFTQSGLVRRDLLPAVVGTAYYSSDAVSCQVQLSQVKPVTAIVACIDVSDLTKEYEAVKTLMSVYDSANPTKAIDTATIQSVRQTTRSSGAIKGSLVTIVKQPNADQIGTGSVLLFGTTSADWEFVADLSEGKSVGKVNMTAENLAKVTDKKWNGVLAGLVGV